MTPAAVIAVLGALGSIASVVPLGDPALVVGWNAVGTDQAVMMMLALAIATGAGVLGAMKPPLRPWQWIAAIASFSFVATKLRPWDSRMLQEPVAYQLLLAVAVVGTIYSIVTYARAALPRAHAA